MIAPNFGGAWRYRHFIVSSIGGEIRLRFARSRLGGLWMIVHPLAQTAIFALVLAGIMAARLPGLANEPFGYALYLLSGTVGWALFSDVVSRCLTLFIDNGNLLKKISFPRICLPLIAAGSALLNNVLLLLAVVVVFALLGRHPGVQIVWVPALMVLTLALGLGVGLVMGVFNVFTRDVGQVVPVVLQFGFWLAPIAYTPDIIPAVMWRIVYLNPMTPIVQSYQAAMLFNRPPDAAALAWLALGALMLLGAALVLFRRASPEMADVL